MDNNFREFKREVLSIVEVYLRQTTERIMQETEDEHKILKTALAHLHSDDCKLGELLNNLATAKGYSQEDIAEVLGGAEMNPVILTSIRGTMRGDDPEPDFIDKIMAMFGGDMEPAK